MRLLLRIPLFLITIPVAILAQTPGVVAIQVSSTAAPFGSAVTLTATTSPATATGRITFFDDASIIGIAALAAGHADITTRMLSSGVHTFRAHYSGDTSYLAGNSTPVTLAVTTLPVAGFPPPVEIGTSIGPVLLATADFNGDGRTDLAGASPSAVGILLGNGDGTFQSARTTAFAGDLSAIAAGDFDGDGRVDLVVCRKLANAVAILLGNGDGTFRSPRTFTVGMQPVSTAVADFNGDGVADLVTANSGEPTVSVLLGNGDGSFRPPVHLLSENPGFFPFVIPFRVAVTDLNADGIADIAVANEGDGGQVNFLLGRGDGTFRPFSGVSDAYGAAEMVLSDLDGDGKIDLAYADAARIAVFHGNRDGSFQSDYQTYNTGSSVAWVVAGDFNGDGRPDLIALDSFVETLSLKLLLGNSIGAFQAPVPYRLPKSPYSIVTGNFDGDGRIDLAIANVDGTVSVYPSRLGFSSVPALSITSSHTGIFLRGQNNAQYAISVSNFSLTTPSSGPVSVTEILPIGFSLVSMSGHGWNCGNPATVCTRADSLPPGSPYPPIAVTVNVDANAPSLSANLVQVDGGGSAPATFGDSTTVIPAFTDVPSNSPYLEAIDVMRGYGINGGCGVGVTFCPDATVARQLMAVYLIRAIFGNDNFSYSRTPYFSESIIPGFFPHVQKLKELGITAGCGNNLFCANTAMTRAELAVWIVRARLGADADATFTYPSAPVFSDVPASHPYFKWIQRMQAESITAGCGPALFCPNRLVTNQEAALWIARALFNLFRPTGTPLLSIAGAANVAPGQTTTLTMTGSNTGFLQGLTHITAGPGVTVGSIQVAGPDLLTVQLSVAASTMPGRRTILVKTGSQEAVLPNGLTIAVP